MGEAYHRLPERVADRILQLQQRLDFGRIGLLRDELGHQRSRTTWW
jgi:hypothetical protein